MAEALCDTTSFPNTPPHAIHTARVKPGPRATFLNGRDACPSDAPSCRQTAYVVPGDQLLTGAARGPYTCAYYTNGRSETAGWLPTARLQQNPDSTVAPSAWIGAWHYGDSTVIIKKAGPSLLVSAEAYWPSKSDPNGHQGQRDAQARLAGNVLALSDPNDPQGCKLTLSLRTTYLIAYDNTLCGGANVSLSGIYRR